MREIKFRGKRVDNGKWVYGYYVKYLNDNNRFEYKIITIFGECIVVNPDTIGQYIGQHGKEIYEGDVIKSIIPKQGIWSEVTIAYGPVFYKSASFRATTGPHSMDWVRLDSLAPTVETEVIGNIYDNPELLGDVNE